MNHLSYLESVLLFNGADTDLEPQLEGLHRPPGLRHVLEVALGQLLGVLVAIWCIFRSDDGRAGVRERAAPLGPLGAEGVSTGAPKRYRKRGGLTPPDHIGAPAASPSWSRGGGGGGGGPDPPDPRHESFNDSAAALGACQVQVRSRRVAHAPLKSKARLARNPECAQTWIFEYTVETHLATRLLTNKGTEGAHSTGAPTGVPTGADFNPPAAARQPQADGIAAGRADRRADGKADGGAGLGAFSGGANAALHSSLHGSVVKQRAECEDFLRMALATGWAMEAGTLALCRALVACPVSSGDAASVGLGNGSSPAWAPVGPASQANAPGSSAPVGRQSANEKASPKASPKGGRASPPRSAGPPAGGFLADGAGRLEESSDFARWFEVLLQSLLQNLVSEASFSEVSFSDGSPNPSANSSANSSAKRSPTAKSSEARVSSQPDSMHQQQQQLSAFLGLTLSSAANAAAASKEKSRRPRSGSLGTARTHWGAADCKGAGTRHKGGQAGGGYPAAEAKSTSDEIWTDSSSDVDEDEPSVGPLAHGPGNVPPSAAADSSSSGARGVGEANVAAGLPGAAEEALHRVKARPLPPKETWPDYPVLVRCSEDVPMKISLPGISAYGALPINDAAHPIPFETSLFKGVAMIRIADISTSPVEYFSGKRRRMQVCVQGCFKRPLRFDEVFGGQEFAGGLRNIPGKWMIKWAFELLKPRLPKSFQADLFCQNPYFLSPLVLTAQKMRADPPGVEPQDVTDHEIFEEMGSILGEKYRGKNDDRARKRAFASADLLQTTTFDTETVYTFDYYQQFLKSESFALDLGVKTLDLHYYLGDQPILLTMAKTIDTGEYLWKFELWHERCVPNDHSRPPGLD